MIAVIQRVSYASVSVSALEIARIEQGLLVLLGIERGDDQEKADKLIHKILGYRVFEDSEGKMNLSLRDIKGELLLVPQFTLAADTKSGMRPGFSRAASPKDGEYWFNYVSQQCEKEMGRLQLGEFAADMKVSLLNDGPVTFLLQV